MGQVYKITNNVNNKCYIGKKSYKNLPRRSVLKKLAKLPK